LIYVAGLEFLLRPMRKWRSPAAMLACLLLFNSVTEFQVRRVAFASPDNFFALARPVARASSTKHMT